MERDPATGQTPRITLVVAAADNGVIGRDGQLPWRLPGDLARFKRLTMNRPLLMGRKTFESIGRPLPGRVSIVLTRQPDWEPGHEGVLVAPTLEAALNLAASAEGVLTGAVMVIGGGEIYRQTLPLADRVELTRVHAHVEGDARFADLPSDEWTLEASSRVEADARNEHPVTHETWERQEATA